MSLSIQQVALQASFLIKRALQAEQQQECQESSLLTLEITGAVREKERGVYMGDKRLGAWERGVMRPYPFQGMQVSQNYL